MKRVIAMVAVVAMLLTGMISMTSCGDDGKITIGISQLMAHEALDSATQGFKDAVVAGLGEENVEFLVNEAAGESNTCVTIANDYVSKNVDLILANGTAALQAAANATTEIPVLGTSVTDYADTFKGNIPANVSGTSDAVPFAEQAQMMIDSLGLVEGDQVGVLYCIDESNSAVQYNAVKELFEAKGIAAKAYTFSEVSELQALVTAMPGECKAIYVPSDNTVAKNDSIVGTICNEKKIPVYTSYGGTICYASLAIDYYQLGYRTGEMAAEILLGGKTPADFQVETLTPSVSYNEELCQQLGITVPEN